MSEHDDYDRATGDNGAPVHIHRPHRIQLMRHVEPAHLKEPYPYLIVVIGVLILIALAGLGVIK